MSSGLGWGVPNPARGDVGQINDFSAMMTRRVEGLEHIATGTLRAAQATEADGFTGATAVAYRFSVSEQTTRRCTAISDVVLRLATAAATYAEDVASFKRQIGYIDGKHEEALTARRAWEDAGYDYQNRYDGQHALRLIEDKEADVRRMYAGLVDRRADADAMVIAALSALSDIDGKPVDILVATGEAMASSVSLSDAEGAVRVAEAIEATRALQPDYDDAEKLAELEALLTSLGDNPDRWNAYYDAVGIEEVMNLVNQIAVANEYPNDETSFAVAAQIAGDLRHGLSRASQDWDQARGEEVARQMIDSSMFRTAADVSFFFGDPNHNPMGESFTVAMANQIDVLEREGGDPRFGIDNGYDHPIVRFSTTLANPADGFTREIFGDSSATVFMTLSKYPDATVEWLLEGTITNQDPSPRMQYWFGERDSIQSAYIGPLSLLEGAEGASGGILNLDPSKYDRQAWINTATILHDGLELLSEGQVTPYSIDGPWGTAASTETLARVLGQYMPYLAEGPLTGGSLTSPDSVIFTGVLHDGDPTEPVANISDETLGRMMRAIADDPTAVKIVRDYTTAYQTEVFDQMDLQHVDVDLGLARIVKTSALIDGTVSGRAAEIQRDGVEGIHVGIDVAATAASILLEEIPYAGIAADVAISGAGDIWAEWRNSDIEGQQLRDIYVGYDTMGDQLTEVSGNAHWAEVSSDGTATGVTNDVMVDKIRAALNDYDEEVNVLRAQIYG